MKRKKLSDEQYFESLSSLFQQVYYPQIEQMEAQLEYLSAIERRDLNSLKEGQMRLNQLKNAPIKDIKEIEKFKQSFISDDHHSYKKISCIIPPSKDSKTSKRLQEPKGVICNLSPLTLPDFTIIDSTNNQSLQPKEPMAQREPKKRKSRLAHKKAVQNLLIARKK